MRFQNTVFLVGTLLQLSNVVLASNGTTLKSSIAARFDYVPLLTCIDELRGVLNGVDYDQPSRIVDCGHDVKFCQKITGHFISATSTTQITMRGCDPIQVEGQFTGIPCQANFLPYAFSDIPNNHCVELFVRVAIAILGPIPCSPYITNPKNGKCNRKYCDLQEAPSASEMCRYMGGELVTICDKDDNDLIAGLAILHPDHLDVLNSVWIGLVRNHIDRNQWEWLSGENCTYRSWFGSEPNDMGGNENHNVNMNTKKEHYDTWNDISLSIKFHYICEWDECPSQKNIVDGE